MKWMPKVEYVKGDKFPWKGYAIKGKKRELIGSFVDRIYHHNSILSVCKGLDFTDEQKEMVIDGFYKTTNLSRESWSGKREAHLIAEEYCNMANRRL